MSASLEELMDALESACLQAFAEMLVTTGRAAQPQVHMFTDGLTYSTDSQPGYFGNILTRPYYQGEDAFGAIVRLGTLPAAIRPTHLLIVWEQSDLETSLLGPGSYQTGVAAVRVGPNAHSVNWYPFLPRVEDSPTGPSIHLDWGESMHYDGVELADVVEDLITEWRRPGGDPVHVVPELLREGYLIDLVQP